MKIIEDIKKFNGRLKNSAVTIGVFDALHIGHLKLIDKLKKRAKALNLKPVLVTFDPYPRETLDGKHIDERLLTRSEKLNLLDREGLFAVAFIKFNKSFSKIDAQSFLKKMLCEKLSMKFLIVGSDFTLGKNQKGNPSYLKDAGSKFGFKVEIVNIVSSGSLGVKSSLIRNLLEQGNVRKVAKLTKRNYSVSGKVIRGAGRGSNLGFSTANIEIPVKLVPKNGVYASISIIGSKRYPSITYIGDRPTFKNPLYSIETYIFNFSDNLYGRKIRLEFLQFLREDIRFKNSQELIEGIKRDIKKAKSCFSKGKL